MVERKLPNRNPEVTELFRLWLGGFGNFARERKANVSMVDTDVNVPGIGRAETDINHPSDLSSPHLLSSLSYFHTSLLLCCFALRERKSGEIRSLGSELSEQL